jgi:hypothetical protein
MRFYNRQHRHYCGIDLHVKTMYVCILDAAGQVLVHRNLPSTPEAFLAAVAPYREDLVVAAECMLTALNRNAVSRTSSFTVARLLDSTTGRRRSVPLTRGGLIGVRARLCRCTTPARLPVWVPRTPARVVTRHRTTSMQENGVLSGFGSAKTADPTVNVAARQSRVAEAGTGKSTDKEKRPAPETVLCPPTATANPRWSLMTSSSRPVGAVATE